MNAETSGQQPDLETLWSKRACAEAKRMCETLDDTDANVDHLIGHIESCEVCLTALAEALDEYLG